MPSAPPHLIEFPVEGLSDGIVRLRLMTDADVPAVTAACQDAAIQRYTTVPAPYSESDARQWLSDSDARRRAGTALAVVMEDELRGEVVGGIDVRREGADSGRWSMGYMVYPGARGRGVATRALRLLSRFALDQLRVRRIEVCVEVENTISQRVAETAGFTREGLLRSYQVIDGARRDMFIYSLLPEDVRR